MTQTVNIFRSGNKLSQRAVSAVGLVPHRASSSYVSPCRAATSMLSEHPPSSQACAPSNKAEDSHSGSWERLARPRQKSMCSTFMRGKGLREPSLTDEPSGSGVAQWGQRRSNWISAPGTVVHAHSHHTASYLDPGWPAGVHRSQHLLPPCQREMEPRDPRSASRQPVQPARDGVACNKHTPAPMSQPPGLLQFHLRCQSCSGKVPF